MSPDGSPEMMLVPSRGVVSGSCNGKLCGWKRSRRSGWYRSDPGGDESVVFESSVVISAIVDLKHGAEALAVGCHGVVVMSPGDILGSRLDFGLVSGQWTESIGVGGCNIGARAFSVWLPLSCVEFFARVASLMMAATCVDGFAE